ncbi:hypothetical protein EDD15DRAFT_2358232 [Pisolithus albus]|nr:hypothetical protein EDD15DRAFT_2358232 [Pisolithus albus]
MSSLSASSCSPVSTAPTTPLSSTPAPESVSPLERGVRETIEKITEVTQLLDGELQASRKEREKAKAELERSREAADSRAAEISELKAFCDSSHPLEHEIKTANNKIANLVDFLSDEVGISRKECDEIALEAERLRELAAHHSSEITRLQTLHDTLRRTWEESILCAMCREPCIHPYLIQECKHTFCLACLQQWFAECLRKDLERVDLPPRLEARRDPPYTAETLEEFYAAGVAYAGLSYTCPFCRARVWEKPKEEPALTCVISALAAVLGPAVQPDSNGDADPDVWAGIFLRQPRE